MIKRLSIVAISFLVAFCLEVLPVAQLIQWIRPDWVGLVLIYWLIALPHRFSLGLAFVVGLLKDIIIGSWLGQTALIYCLIGYVAIHLSHRIRVFPLWQQAIVVFLLILVEQLFIFWLAGVAQKPTQSPLFWLSSVTSMLLWPWVFALLRTTRRRFKLR